MLLATATLMSFLNTVECVIWLIRHHILYDLDSEIYIYMYMVKTEYTRVIVLYKETLTVSTWINYIFAPTRHSFQDTDILFSSYDPKF